MGVVESHSGYLLADYTGCVCKDPSPEAAEERALNEGCADRRGRRTPLMKLIPVVLHFSPTFSGNRNGSLEMLCVRAVFVRPRNGRRPKRSSYAQTPSDHQSMG
jgi:hypothetical protein